MVRRRTRNKPRGKAKPKIDWDVPKAERSQGRAVARGKPKVTYTGTGDREDFKPECDRSPKWNSAKDKLTGGVKQLPRYVNTKGLSRELVAVLVPGRMFILREPVQLIDEKWDDRGKNMPVPLVHQHHPRKYDLNYDPKKEIHMPKGGMIVYVGHEIVDALTGNHARATTVRMDVYKFLINDGVYMITDMRLVQTPN